jgi:mannose-6-phosphate isomerase-like protein (cupin superfamily)
LNGQHVRLAKLLGDFVWHHHDHEDELFFVVQGNLLLEYRDATGAEKSVEIEPGEFVIMPRGVEHRPRAAEEVHVMLFEPAATVNTGNLRNERTMNVTPV